MSLYTYQMDFGGGWVSVNPRGEWTITRERNAGQIFFRRILQGDLVFQGADYTLITGSTDCEVLEFRILCDGSEHWVGQFKYPYAFSFDEDTCECTGTPEVVDEYSCIMDMYEVEYETFWLIVANKITIEFYDTSAVNQGSVNNCAPIYDTFDLILNNASYFNCGLTIKSSFIWEDNFPNGDNYAASYGTNNYITGAANVLDKIHWRQTTAIRAQNAGTGCDTTDDIKTSFKLLESWLRDRFNAYWYIDQNGHFRIEHIHFFDFNFPESDFDVGIDLTTLTSNNGRTFAYRRNKYTYETGELYDQERWTWQHYTGTEGGVTHLNDFAGVPIYYGGGVNQKSDCVPGEFKEKEVATPSLLSDAEWMIALIVAGNIDAMDCNGVMMFDADDTFAPARIRIAAGAISAANRVNGNMSTANLQEDYFTWDRIFINGNMNSGAVVFDSAQPIQLQKSIEFMTCCDDIPSPLNQVTTELGDGRVKAMTEKMNSVEVELLY